MTLTLKNQEDFVPSHKLVNALPFLQQRHQLFAFFSSRRDPACGSQAGWGGHAGGHGQWAGHAGGINFRSWEAGC